ncbi:[protein-PII] uridylyltransferase [Bordetella pertussis]|nr:[protein-PII] uridylyltransferase [Bordetella pertussis]
MSGSALERPRSQMQFERAILDALAGDEPRQQAA